MKTLYDVVNAPKEAQVNLEDCVIVKQQEDGTYNVVVEINKAKVYVNYVDASKCKNNKLYVRFGKKEEKWHKERWYQVEAPEDAEVKETEKKE